MFAPIVGDEMRNIAQRLENLTKSFHAGYQGIQNAGRTGVSALANDHIDPVLRSITMEESDFFLTKDIATEKAKQSVYTYRVKTAVQDGQDLAGFESFLPVESASQYMRVAEVLKVYGVRKSITQMAQMINSEDGYAVDLEQENDQNAAMAMAQSMERDLYYGGDLFINSSGDIDGTVASNINGPLRQVRGIQANVVEGNSSMRGIPGDFIGYGNNRSVVFDRRGAVLERGFLNKVVTAVKDSRGSVAEAHCTTTQLSEFANTFFPIERADIGQVYAINGSAVSNDEKEGFPIRTVAGVVNFIPSVFRYRQTSPIMRQASVGSMPSAPAFSVAAAGSVTGSGFVVGDIYSYRVQAVNVYGASATTASSITVGAGDADKAIDVTITNVSSVEYYAVFRTPVEAAGVTGQEMFIGKIIPSSGASTIFRDNNKIIPGLDDVLFLPKNKDRVKLAILGQLLNKLALGPRGTAFEHVYASYFACIVHRPRSLALVRNVYGQREGIS